MRELQKKDSHNNSIEILKKNGWGLNDITSSIIKNYRKTPQLCRLQTTKIPSKDSMITLVQRMLDLIYPGFYGEEDINHSNLEYHTGSEIYGIFQSLTGQIYGCIRHHCKKIGDICQHCYATSQTQTVMFLEKLSHIRNLLLTDLYAAYRGDPAAKSYDEVIISYPGYFAITVYRIAHELYEQQVPLLPRMMTEYAHGETGIDIHPGAKIGKGFFIDHGTGVVIGETTEIGDNVTVYQGVTLGALKFKRRSDGSLVKGGKRHPTIGNDVTIYSGATILGGETRIGDRSVVGGNVWLTHSIPSDTTIILAEPRLKTINKNIPIEYQI